MSDPAALDRIGEVIANCRLLLEEIKESTDVITLADSRELYSGIRQAEGWLLSARKLLEPPGIL